MKLLLIQPPKLFWPYVSEGDNFLLPQWMVCVGAAARQAGHEVKLIDCSPMKIGWKSLEEHIRRHAPDAVGVGENHALYSGESLRAMRTVKEVRPEAVTIAGGSHFTNLIEETLDQKYVDYIVLREGEETLVELLDAISGGKNPAEVRGIAYRENGATVITGPRPLIEDMDSLPMPAYDIAAMDMYGRSKYLFSPGGTTIHHSRGCVSNCRFCAWWMQMADVGEDKDGELSLRPKWRTKSVGRTVEEIDLLANKYGKKCLVFVDEFWNQDPEWSDKFSEEMISRKMGVVWFAFMRADAILRDEKIGVFEKIVKSGLVHVSIGVEHADAEKLKSMGKGFYTKDSSLECFHLLRDKYPEVFRQGTFIVGLRTETRESMLAQSRYARDLDLDYPGFHPITPVPGTSFWKEARDKGWIEVTDYAEYDWMTPIISSEYMTRDEIEILLIDLNKRFVSVKWFLRGIFSRSSYRRKMYLWWLIVTLRVVYDSVKRFAWPFSTKAYTGLVKPPWYDN